MRACVSVSIRLDYRKALERYKPAVVVCSWMPWEHDWTGEAAGWMGRDGAAAAPNSQLTS